MNLTNYYNLLGLDSKADMEQIKTSYRHLARQYHPDFNSSEETTDKFIQLTEAYKYLIEAVERKEQAKRTKVNNQPQHFTFIPELSEYEQKLKWNSYQSLKQLLKEKRLVRAITLVEGLAQRLPQDPEVRQWQAIIYQQRGRQLISDRQIEKAKIYFKKALKTDPYNRSLWAEVTHYVKGLKRGSRQ